MDPEELTLQEDPVKVFIGDISKFVVDKTNKYHFYFCGMKFKNIHVHGVVTEVYALEPNLINLQLSDPTGSIDVCYNPSRFEPLPLGTMAKLCEELEENKRSVQSQSVQTLTWMMDDVKKSLQPVNFEEGDCASVVGDVFTDNITGNLKISSFNCCKTSLAMDLVWMQELVDLYRDQYYSKK